MATYTPAPKDVLQLLEDTLRTRHPELVEIGLTLRTLMAHPARNEETGEPKGPALVRGGYPLHAVVLVNSHRQRAAGKDDVDLLLDAEHWDELTARQREALLHDQLLYLEVKSDEDGNVLLDDCLRPKLKVRAPDFEVRGFLQTMEDFGPDAPEMRGFATLREKVVQLGLFDAEADEPAVQVK